MTDAVLRITTLAEEASGALEASAQNSVGLVSEINDIHDAMSQNVSVTERLRNDTKRFKYL